MNCPPDKYPVLFHLPSFLQNHMIFHSHADLAQKYFPQQHIYMSHRPFEFDPQDNQHPPFSTPHHPQPVYSISYPSQHHLHPPHSIPPSISFYSTSGFDMLSVLSKVVTRHNPRIMLGPVDMTCSFLVSDIRSGDAPIVYVSPTFCCLTGYTEAEVLGRNCRFLQSPSGSLQRGDPRLHTAPDAVRLMHRSITEGNECQTSLINYRKDGSAFVNLVTLIPICVNNDEPDVITHFIGFQVDLAQQPSAIMQKLRDGTYIVNYSMATVGGGGVGAVGGMAGRRGKGVSAQLVETLRRAAAVVVPASDSVAPSSDPSAQSPPSMVRDDDYSDIQSLILDNSDDFIHVLSLKGSLLYVAPSVFRILGYTSSELIGRSMSDLCHPADIVPVMRELKEASSPSPHVNPVTMSNRPSTTPVSASISMAGPGPLYSAPAYGLSPHHPQLYPATSMHPYSSQLPHAHLRHPFALPQPTQPAPRPLTSLLFRARHKAGHYVWLLCRGRLHVEPGKGRKAVVMVGRVVRGVAIDGLMERQLLKEGGEDCAGGRDLTLPSNDWGIVAPNGIVLSGGESLAGRCCSSSPKDGTSTPLTGNEVLGRTLSSFIPSEVEARRVGEVLAAAACAEEACVKKAWCTLHSGQDVEMRFYAVDKQISSTENCTSGRLPAGVVFEAVLVKEGGENVDSSRMQMQFQRQPGHISPNFMSQDLLNLGEPAYMPPHAQNAVGDIGYPIFPYPQASQPSTYAEATFPTHIHSPPALTLPIPSHIQSSPLLSSPSSPPEQTGTSNPPVIAMSVSPQDTSPNAQLSFTSSNTYGSSSTSATAIASVNDYSASSSSSSHHSHHEPLPLSLSQSAETSWQYELTRLKFENERLKVEAARLERRGRRRGLFGPGHSAVSEPSSSSRSSSNQQLTRPTIPVTIGGGMKRCREE